MARVAFIGLGAMGLPMATNLAAAGHEVIGFDRATPALDAAAQRGLRLAASIEAASEGADVVLTMLPGGEHVISVWREMTAASPGALYLDCSTIGVESAQRAHRLARDRGALSVDAPVSGGVAAAQAGALTFMCGSESEALEKARPVLQSMGARVIHCGGAGMGQAAKICNNLMLGVTMAATAEAFVLAEKLGLSARALFDAASASSGQSWSLTSYCPAPGLTPSSPANDEYKAGFKTRLMLKDLRLAEAAGKDVAAGTPMTAAAERLYALFADEGGGERDFSGVIQALRGRSAEAPQ